MELQRNYTSKKNQKLSRTDQSEQLDMRGCLHYCVHCTERRCLHEHSLNQTSRKAHQSKKSKETLTNANLEWTEFPVTVWSSVYGKKKRNAGESPQLYPKSRDLSLAISVRMSSWFSCSYQEGKGNPSSGQFVTHWLTEWGVSIVGPASKFVGFWTQSVEV